MYQSLVEKCSVILSFVNPIFLFSFVMLVGLYIFWRGCTESRKDNSSVFDIFFLSSLFGIITGRISYIVSHWSDFSSLVWYWLPYEKYGEEIFLFRVLPWRFLRIWDWGLDILLLFVGLLLFATAWIVIVKRWRWSHVFTTLFFTTQIMLGFSFLLLGVLTKNNDWIIQGVVMILLPLVLFFLKNSVRNILTGIKESKVLIVLDIFFILLTATYVTHSYLSTEITNMEKGGVFLFLAWTILGTIFYISTSKRANVTIEKLSSVQMVSPIDINQPIKLPK